VAERSLKGRISDVLNRVFVPREIFLRSDGQVQFLRISPLHQKLAVAAVAFVAAWGLYSSTSFVVHHFTMASKDREIERHKLAYFDLLAEVGEYHQQFARITQDLEENQSFLLSMLEQEPGRRGDLENIQERLKTSETERERVVVAREGLRSKLTQFETDLRDIANRNVSLQGQVKAMRDMLYTTETQRVQVAEARERLGRKLEVVERDLASMTEAKRQLELTVADLQENLTASRSETIGLEEVGEALQGEIAVLEGQLKEAGERENGLTQQVASVAQELAEATLRGDQLQSEKTFLETRVDGMQQRMDGYRDSQLALVGRLRNQTDLSLDALEKTIAMTGIDIDNYLAALDLPTTSQGGPFVSADGSDDSIDADELDMSLSLLDLRLNRWQALQELIRSIPFSAPLEQYRITSSFGTRRDPVNGRKARHNGMDFGGPIRTSVYSTAPGKVVFAGWRGYYGRMVEIDHGNGVRTRYAHLKRILVKAGDVLPNRHKIGLLGSSGRSTGPHVHYEVRVKGKPLNPAKFLTAGRHVFKD